MEIKLHRPQFLEADLQLRMSGKVVVSGGYGDEMEVRAVNKTVKLLVKYF